MTELRDLSDAVKADYDRLMEKQTRELATADRWKMVRDLSAAVLLCYVGVLFVLVLWAALTGSLMAMGVATMLSLKAPEVFIVGGAVLCASVFRAHTLSRQLREKMFTLYGIAVDETITPHVYSAPPRAFVGPQLESTRAAMDAQAGVSEPA